MVTTHRIYDAFGALQSTTPDPAAVDHIFHFTGQYRDEETELQNHLNRWYDPLTGRWPNEDPIGFAAGDANLYRYCGNEPSGSTDLSGLDYIKEGAYFMYGQIPMRHLYAVTETLFFDVAMDYVGFEDPTGVVYRIHTPAGPNFVGAEGLVESWYMGLDAKCNSVSRAAVESELFGWHTDNWAEWFRENHDNTTEFMRAARQSTLMGTFKHSSDFYNQKTILVNSIPWTIAEGATLQAGYAFSFFRAASTGSVSVSAASSVRGSWLVVGGGRARGFPKLRPGDVALNLDRGALPHVVGDIRTLSPSSISGAPFKEIFFERVPFHVIDSRAASNAARLLRSGGRLEIITGRAAGRNAIEQSLRGAGFMNVQFEGTFDRALRVTATLGGG